MTASRVRRISLAALVLAACGQAPSPENRPGEPDRSDPDPAQLFFDLEDRLVQARTLSIGFHVTAEGAIEVDLRGTFRVEADGSIQLSASGIFAGETVDVGLASKEGEYEYGNGPERARASTPPFLQEALAVGFTRMGILHNLAMLVAGAPPDGGQGGVKEWVQVDNLRAASADGDGQGTKAVSFSITVAGQPSGSAVLEMGPEGLPVVRRQTVRFPSGEMRVVERYVSASITPQVSVSS